MADRKFKVGDELEFLPYFASSWKKCIYEGECSPDCLHVRDTDHTLFVVGPARVRHKQPPKKPEPFYIGSPASLAADVSDAAIEVFWLDVLPVEDVERFRCWLQQAKAYLEWEEAQGE